MFPCREKLELEYSLLYEKRKRESRKSLLAFTKFTKPDYQANWHHVLLCDYLDRFVSGDIKNLMVFMPPQHGKSELVSRRLPAYLHGKDPDLRIAGCAYSAEFVRRFNRDCQRIIDSKEYSDSFPETFLSSSNVRSSAKGSYVRNTDMYEIVGRRGYYTSVGTGGPLTGVTVDIGIIDDPIKDRVEAESVTYRNRVWDWYNDVFMTRMHKDSKQLFTMTRWHEDDLAGRILSDCANDWVVLSLPRIKEIENNLDPRAIGETLWPEKHSLKAALKIKEKQPYSFASLQQQAPSPKGGGMFRDDRLQYWESLPDPDMTVLSIDATFKGGDKSDFVSIDLWQKSGPNFYIVDNFTKKMGFLETCEAIEAKIREHNPDSILIEDKANGPAIIDSLSNKFSSIIPVNPEGGKEARASMVEGLWNGGNIYAPKYASWVKEWLHQWSAFPSGMHDDNVDSGTQALTYLENKAILMGGGTLNSLFGR